MKNVIVLAVILFALFYAQRSCTPPGERVAGQKAAHDTVSAGGGPRQWEQAPNAVMDMHNAMGGASGGASRAARDAVTQQLAR